VSGLSGDMREILAHIAQGSERAQLAFDVYVHRLCQGIGAMLASLGGLDALVFTGGIGENCAPLRERVAKQFEFLGKIPILVIRAEEDWEIARECYRVVAQVS
jgi:acetate kinase